MGVNVETVTRDCMTVSAAHKPVLFWLRGSVAGQAFGVLVLTGEFIEVRDSRTGYFIPVRYGIGLWPDGRVVGTSSSPSSASSGNSGRHSGQETMFGGFPIFGLLVRDLGEWRPGFCTESRCASREHSGLAWGAIFEKVIQNEEIHTF